MKKVLLFLAVFIPLAAFATADAATQNDVLINEIAWMGTANSANDEWIELFNNTDSPIDLSGWILRSADDPSVDSGQVKLKINLKGQIPVKGFYLLERTDDSSVPGITTDLIYKGALTNGGMDLKLYDNLGNPIDQVNYLSGWPAGDNKTKQTMERINGVWQTSKNPNGTPKTENSTGVISNPQAPPPESNTQHPIFSPSQILPEQNLGGQANQNPTPTTTYPDGVFINEILPSPEGADETNEWIELYNSNSFDINLSGWKIQDTQGTTTTYILSKDSNILANRYLVLKRPETKITLNNENDGLNLMLPDDKIIDSVSYNSAPKNQSYNKREPIGNGVQL